MKRREFLRLIASLPLVRFLNILPDADQRQEFVPNWLDEVKLRDAFSEPEGTVAAWLRVVQPADAKVWKGWICHGIAWRPKLLTDDEIIELRDL